MLLSFSVIEIRSLEDLLKLIALSLFITKRRVSNGQKLLNLSIYKLNGLLGMFSNVIGVVNSSERSFLSVIMALISLSERVLVLGLRTITCAEEP